MKRNPSRFRQKLAEKLKQLNIMSKPSLFQYAVIFHPTEKEKKDEGKKAAIIVQPSTILAGSLQEAQIAVAMSIPQEYKDKLDQIDVAVKPF